MDIKQFNLIDMKTYKIAFEFYPFDMENLKPRTEFVDAESLESAFDRVQEKYGAGKIEIFKEPARKYYKE
jgi:hypothetical protein